jgi:ATP/maltotriose-dependent transcriptional regulator MalT
VFDQTEGARHLPFFAELAGLEDGDPAWRSVSAGLVVLRLVDAWIEEGSAAVAADGWGMRSVEAAIEEVPTGLPAHGVLRSVVEALKSSPVSDMHAIAPRLMAYARSLDLDAKWALAADVYETVIAHVHPTEESDAAISAHVRLSYCRRQLGELDLAERIASQAGRIALTAGDIIGSLQARIAEAKVSIARGNYPRAENMLDETIARATSESLDALRAHAIQERADVAYLKGEFEYAIKLGYTALNELTEERARDRMLNDIAGAFYKLGVRSAARDAYSLLSLTAQEQYLRWVAAINLMEIAAGDGSFPLFERFRRDLEDAALPPLLRTQFLIHAGQGLVQLGDTKSASRMLSRAMQSAAEYGYNRLAFQAEEELATLASKQRVAPAENSVPPALEVIADAIYRRRLMLTST